jgi:hypothetical protein
VALRNLLFNSGLCLGLVASLAGCFYLTEAVRDSGMRVRHIKGIDRIFVDSGYLYLEYECDVERGPFGRGASKPLWKETRSASVRLSDLFLPRAREHSSGSRLSGAFA